MHILTAGSLRHFAHEHDDLPAFHAGYLVLALFSALLLPLGAFALLIALHAILDVVKYREVHSYSWKRTCEGVFREGLLDMTLLMIGLVCEVYLHSSVGVASVSGLLRTEFFIVEILGTTLPKFSILHHILKIFAHVHHYMENVHPRMQKNFSDLDVLCVTFLGVSVLLLIFAPFLMHTEGAVIRHILNEQMLFWKV